MSKRKVLIISPRAFGYVKYLYNELKKHEDLEVNIVYLESLGYKNNYQKTLNFFSKLFTGVNLKKNYYFLESEVKAFGYQDEIFMIRPDFVTNGFLKTVKKQTAKLVAYYWDSAQRVERKKDVIRFFDKIFSFDKIDVKQYNFQFITNYIFESSTVNDTPEYLFFNISGNDDDYRFGQLEAFGKYLKASDWSFKFISFHPKLEMANRGIIDVVDEIIYVDEVIELIKKTKILVEFQRKQQIGLSFRIFESLGLQKKLITNNTDIVNYDFYNPQNILVVDADNPIVPEHFVNSPYIPIEESVLQKYRLEHWVNHVFDL
ncbi:hypothetical protein [Lacinutrix jangbogonensis]|uniref:hypothetical protein n=1 Tax=Lacinutrix jangbogonensis TaxID=1469557 RepID=UPI00068A2D10|nr:hypothetical protein [Lacinutrix jangbogonensis]